MARKIFVVYGKVVDANGSYNTLTGYPKVFDSRNYGGDINKAKRRAEGEFSETWGAMCKVDSRQVQTVILMSQDGFVHDVKTFGNFPDEPEPEPEEGEGE